VGRGTEENPCIILIGKTHGKKPLVRLWRELEDTFFFVVYGRTF
jgi:hypothetical protein